jgi:hypothetical protein
LHAEAEVRHLFRGHEVVPGSRIVLSAANETAQRSVAFAATEALNALAIGLPGTADYDRIAVPSLALEVTGDPKPAIPWILLTPAGGLIGASGTPRRSSRRTSEPSIFIASESLTIDELVGLWNSVSLTPAESLVLRALQFIDPEIERIAVQVTTANSYYRSGSRGGFIVKRRGMERPIPIGSLGDGVWRMLVMAIAITQCRGGVLLVDEIDTGLHHSIMSEMWQLIYNTAKELDVQVFATTHSYDCVYSLAPLCASADEQNPITVQRIEHGKSAAIPYALNQVRIAAEHQIEVR